MQIAITVLQNKALQLGIKCINKAIIFDLLTKASAWATPEVINGDVYYFVARQKIADELPILHLKPDTVYRHLKDLAALGLISYLKKDKKDCIKLTEKGKSYLSKNDDLTMSEMNPNYYVGNESEKKENSEINPKKLGNKSEKTRNEIRHNNKLYYQEDHINNNNITSSLHSEVIQDNESFEIANYLLLKILTFKPNFKRPNLKHWAKDIDLAIRIDKRTPQELIKAIDWIYTPEGDFWKVNVLSCKKLREKFDTIEAQAMNSKKTQENNVVSAYVAMRQQGLTLKDMEQMQ